MDGIIIFFLIVITLYYLGKWYIRRKIRKFFGQFGGQQAGGATGHNQEDTYTKSKKGRSSAKSPEKKKVFTADEGEYVEFEEIKD